MKAIGLGGVGKTITVYISNRIRQDHTIYCLRFSSSPRPRGLKTTLHPCTAPTQQSLMTGSPYSSSEAVDRTALGRDVGVKAIGMGGVGKTND